MYEKETPERLIKRVSSFHGTRIQHYPVMCEDFLPCNRGCRILVPKMYLFLLQEIPSVFSLLKTLRNDRMITSDKSDRRRMKNMNRNLKPGKPLLYPFRSPDYTGWEEKVTDYTVDDVDEELLLDYFNEGTRRGRLSFPYKDARNTLWRLKLVEGGLLNNAGYCIFSKRKPLTLKLSAYPGTEMEFQGNIFECISEAEKFVKDNIFREGETPEIPTEALREIIINSFVHRKMDEGLPNEIRIIPSKVKIHNPGSMPKGYNKEFAYCKKGSLLRNPLIATVLYFNGTIEAFATGLERVQQLCRNCTGYSSSNDESGFTFEFLRNFPYD